MITTFIVNLEEVLQGHILLLKILFIYYIVMYKTLLNAIKKSSFENRENYYEMINNKQI